MTTDGDTRNLKQRLDDLHSQPEEPHGQFTFCTNASQDVHLK